MRSTRPRLRGWRRSVGRTTKLTALPGAGTKLKHPKYMDSNQTSKTPSTPAVDRAAPCSALDRATILAVRLRIIEMYESLRTLADQCYKEDGGQQMGDSLNAQIFGMIKVRQMVGAMLDEQAGNSISGAHVRGIAEMPATTKAGLVDMIAHATEAIERGDFDDETNQPAGLGAPGAQMRASEPDGGIQDNFGCHKEVAKWLEASKYRTLIHRHDGCFVAVDDAEQKLTRADTLPLLADLLMNWPDSTDPLPTAMWIKVPV
jgi:hypothetical protein